MPAVRPIQTPTMPSPTSLAEDEADGGADGPVAEQAEEHRARGCPCGRAAARRRSRPGPAMISIRPRSSEELGGEAGGGEAGGAGVEEAVGERLRGGGERGEEQRARGEAEA